MIFLIDNFVTFLLEKQNKKLTISSLWNLFWCKWKWVRVWRAEGRRIWAGRGRWCLCRGHTRGPLTDTLGTQSAAGPLCTPLFWPLCSGKKASLRRLSYSNIRIIQNTRMKGWKVWDYFDSGNGETKRIWRWKALKEKSQQLICIKASSKKRINPNCTKWEAIGRNGVDKDASGGHWHSTGYLWSWNTEYKLNKYHIKKNGKSKLNG